MNTVMILVLGECFNMVDLRRLELAIYALKGHRPEPLDDRSIVLWWLGFLDKVLSEARYFQ